MDLVTGSGTRVQLLDLLKRGEWTVPELADRLHLTSNAVRHQLSVLERAGWVEQAGMRPGRRRPAAVYRATPALAVAESRAYGPVLAVLIEVLSEKLSDEVLLETFQLVGSRLAASQSRPLGGRPERFRHAQQVLAAFGGTVDVIEDYGPIRLEGTGCPLALAVRGQPGMCEAVRTLLSDIIGEQLVEECDRDAPGPRCCFRAAS